MNKRQLVFGKIIRGIPCLIINERILPISKWILA